MVTGLLLVTNHIKSRLLVTNTSSWFRPEAQPFFKSPVTPSTVSCPMFDHV